MAASFQFSIRLMLVAIAMVAAGLAVVSAEPSFHSALAIDGLTVAFTTTAAVCTMCAKGGFRAFWAGTGIMLAFASIDASFWIPVLALAIKHGTADQQTFEANRCLCWLWCGAPVNGLFAAIIHWLVAPRTPASGQHSVEVRAASAAGTLKEETTQTEAK